VFAGNKQVHVGAALYVGNVLAPSLFKPSQRQVELTAAFDEAW